MKQLNFGRFLILLLLTSLFITACDSAEEATPTATAVAVAEDPTAEPATEEPEPTDTAVPEPTSTAEPEPTATTEPEPTATDEPEPTATAVPQPVAQFDEASCEFDVPSGFDVTCGWLTVPEDHFDSTNEKTIQLHIAIFASESSSPEPEPIVYLEGGPGGEPLEAIPFTFASRFAPFLVNHDLIMYDQRGTGYSQPSLACPETYEMAFDLLEQDLSYEELTEISFDTIFTCHERLLSEGVNLAAYNSAQSAADLAAMREALGYDAWNLWGISYGTRLAQTTMRDHPEGLRSVILDSTYPLEANLLTDTPANAGRAFDVFFAGCAADEACNAAYPNLETVFYETVAQLNAETIRLPVNNLFTGESYNSYFVGDDLLGILFQSLYSTEIIPDLPKLIYDVNQGETTTLSALVSSFMINGQFFSLGMQFSVQCNEENSFTNAEEITAGIAAYPELENFFKYSPNLGTQALTICDAWGAGVADGVENEPVSSDIPTLVLAGEYDPITPPAWGELVANHLGNAYYYEFPGTGHGASIAGDCPFDVTQSFLAMPDSAPDASCIASLGGPTFTVPSEENEAITLVPFSNSTFGIEGVVPEGWEEVQIGTYSRGNSGLDQTLIIQQGAPGVSADQLLGILATQLGLEEAPESEESYEDVNGRSWALYEAELQGFPAIIALADQDGITLLILFVADSAEIEFLSTEVFIPAMDALKVIE